MADLRRTFESLVLMAGHRLAPPVVRRIDALRALRVHIRTVDGHEHVDTVTRRDLVLDGDSIRGGGEIVVTGSARIERSNNG